MNNKKKQLIEFTPEKFKQLKKEYNIAVKEGKESFMFLGQYELLTSYAKYLIEYLESKFENLNT
jgi:hypothetical protein